MLTNDVASFFKSLLAECIRFWNQFVAGPNHLQMPGSKRKVITIEGANDQSCNVCNGSSIPISELEDQGITRIVIADSKNLEIYFNNPVEASEFEFKILKEVKIDKLSGLENKLVVSLSGSLNTNSDYLLMAISIVDSEWQEVFFEDGIYDFNTSEELEIIEEVKEEFNSAPDEKDIEEVAEWLETTPQAWAETWILLLLTLIVNTWIYLRKRILA